MVRWSVFIENEVMKVEFEVALSNFVLHTESTIPLYVAIDWAQRYRVFIIRDFEQVKEDKRMSTNKIEFRYSTEFGLMLQKKMVEFQIKQPRYLIPDISLGSLQVSLYDLACGPTQCRFKFVTEVGEISLSMEVKIVQYCCRLSVHISLLHNEDKWNARLKTVSSSEAVTEVRVQVPEIKKNTFLLELAGSAVDLSKSYLELTREVDSLSAYIPILLGYNPLKPLSDFSVSCVDTKGKSLGQVLVGHISRLDGPTYYQMTGTDAVHTERGVFGERAQVLFHFFVPQRLFVKDLVRISAHQEVESYLKVEVSSPTTRQQKMYSLNPHQEGTEEFWLHSLSRYALKHNLNSKLVALVSSEIKNRFKVTLVPRS